MSIIQVNRIMVSGIRDGKSFEEAAIAAGLASMGNFTKMEELQAGQFEMSEAQKADALAHIIAHVKNQVQGCTFDPPGGRGGRSGWQPIIFSGIFCKLSQTF